MVWIVAALYLAAGALPVAALWIARRTFVRDATDIEQRFARVTAAKRDPHLTEEDRAEVARVALGEDLRWTYFDATVTPLWVMARIYENARADYGLAARLVVSGVVLGTVASLWSLWL